MADTHFSEKIMSKFSTTTRDLMNTDFESVLKALPKYLRNNDEFTALLSDEISSHYILPMANLDKLKTIAENIMEEECPNGPCSKCMYYMGKEYSFLKDGTTEVRTTRCLGLLLYDISKQFS